MLGKACLENEFLKEPCSEPWTAQEKRQFVTDHRDLLETVTRGCQLMNLPRSSYYYHVPSLRRTPRRTGVDRSDRGDRRRVSPVWLPEGYGPASSGGLLVNHKKIQRIMRERGWGSRDAIDSSRQLTAIIPIHLSKPDQTSSSHRDQSSLGCQISRILFGSRWPSSTCRLSWDLYSARPSAMAFRIGSTRI